MGSRTRRGFTLVEILVVLAIIGILAAILFAVFGRVREEGRKTVCSSNQHQIMLALAVYLQDSGGQLPWVADFGASSQAHGSLVASSWTQPLLPYLASPDTLRCPSDTLWSQRQMVITTASPPHLPSSYIWNLRLLSIERFDWAKGSTYVVARMEKEMMNPTSTVLLCDGSKNSWPQPPYAVADYPSDGAASDQFMRGDILADASAGGGATCCNPKNASCVCGSVFAPNDRHLGRANVAFADGHVKAMLNSDWYFPNTPYLDPKRGG